MVFSAAGPELQTTALTMWYSMVWHPSNPVTLGVVHTIPAAQTRGTLHRKRERGGNWIIILGIHI